LAFLAGGYVTGFWRDIKPQDVDKRDTQVCDSKNEGRVSLLSSLSALVKAGRIEQENMGKSA